MVKTNRSLTLPQAVRLAFPQLFEARPIKIGGQPKGDPKFSVGIAIHKSLDENVYLLNATQQDMIRTAWPDGNYPTNFHWATQWGPQSRPKDANLSESYYLNAYSNQDSPPQIVTRNPQGGYLPVTDRSAIYSGCEAYVNIGLFCYQTTAQDGGIGVGINLVMPTGRDVGRFDGRATAAGAFDSLGDVETLDPAGGPAPGYGMGTPHQPDAGMVSPNAPSPGPGPAGPATAPWQARSPAQAQAQPAAPATEYTDPTTGQRYSVDPNTGQMYPVQ